MPYKIECRFTYGWDDAGWHDVDGKPLRFATRADAEADLEEFIDTTREAAARGDLSEPYDPADYRITEETP